VKQAITYLLQSDRAKAGIGDYAYQLFKLDEVVERSKDMEPRYTDSIRRAMASEVQMMWQRSLAPDADDDVAGPDSRAVGEVDHPSGESLVGVDRLDEGATLAVLDPDRGQRLGYPGQVVRDFDPEGQELTHVDEIVESAHRMQVIGESELTAGISQRH
jgi:hypothetical protein